MQPQTENPKGNRLQEDHSYYVVDRAYTGLYSEIVCIQT